MPKKQSVLCALAVAGALVALPAAAYAAGSGSSSGVGGLGNAPSGYGSSSSEVLAEPISFTGGHAFVATVTANGQQVTVTVPAADSALSGDQLAITAPPLSNVQDVLPQAGFPGYRAVSALGVTVLDKSGAEVSGQFASPIQVKISGSGLGTSGQQVVKFTGPTTAAAIPATLATGSVSVPLSSDPALAVLTPTSTAPGSTVGATTKPTGKPFALELDIAYALGLIALGAGAVGVRRKLAPARVAP